jgi:hypothetical protein
MFKAIQKVKIVSTDSAECLKQYVGQVGIYTGAKGSVRRDYTLIQLDGGKSIFC